VKLFFKKILLFSIPFVVYYATIAIIDPYNYFGSNKIVSDAVKEKISRPLNYPLWEILKYRRQPNKNILIGDSRIGAVDVRRVYERTGEQYFKYSIGGGNANEIISTFWYVASITKLENVYIGINLELYNKANIRDRVSGVVSIMNNPFLYLVNSNVTESSYYIVSSYLRKETISVGVPDMSKEEFWDYQLTVTAARYYANYIYPDNYLKEFTRIAEYCRDNNTRLVFVVFPTHTDLQQLMLKYNLVSANERFISDLRKIGTVYDLNFGNRVTSDKTLFGDPFHMEPELFNEIYTDLIWSKNTQPSDSLLRVYHDN